jgi:hypothetical protein
LGALTPLGQRDDERSIYTKTRLFHIAGSLSSAILAGISLGWLGSRLPVRISEQVAWFILGTLSLTFILREFGWMRFPVPQMDRQTNKTWRSRFGPESAAWWWGLDLGSGLTTLVTFSGYWLLVLATLFKGEVIYGGLVIGLYGLGRALSVILVPLLFDSRISLVSNLVGLWDNQLYLRRGHDYALMGLTVGLLLHSIISG